MIEVMEFLKDWSGVIGLVFGAGAVARTFLKRDLEQDLASSDELDAVEKAVTNLAAGVQENENARNLEVTELRHKVELLEKDLKNLPGFAEINGLKRGIAELREGQTEAKTTLRLLSEQVSRMDEFLRQHDR